MTIKKRIAELEKMVNGDDRPEEELEAEIERVERIAAERLRKIRGDPGG